MSASNKWVIALEFGGWAIKAARVNQDGNLEDFFKFELDHKQPPMLEDFLSNLSNIIQKAKDEKNIYAVGISAPAPYDPDTLTFNLTQKSGYINRESVYKYVNGNPLKTAISEYAACKDLYIENDAVLAARGEIWKGNKIRHTGRYMFLTLGTGLGGCYIIDGEFVKGEHNGATESGEIWDYPFMGKYLEDVIGTTKAMIRIYEELGGKDPRVIAGDIKSLSEMAKNREGKAIKSFNKFGKLLGEGLFKLVSRFKPESIVLSGNIAHAYDFFVDEAKRSLVSTTTFLKSDLIDTGGLLGAAYIAFNNIHVNRIPLNKKRNNKTHQYRNPHCN